MQLRLCKPKKLPRNSPASSANKVIHKRTKLLIPPNDLESPYTNFNIRTRKIPSLPSFSSQSELWFLLLEKYIEYYKISKK